jgi:hypothetical protein
MEVDLVNPIRRGALAAFLLLLVGATAPLIVRWAAAPQGPSVEIRLPDGREWTVSLSTLRGLPTLTRSGEVQNQFGNWRDAGIYTGVLLPDLIGDATYSAIVVEASDGYRVTVDRERVCDLDYPMVLAYALDGIEVPEWADGFRIVVLPDDGRVSNDEYGSVSAGSYWVKNVVRIVIEAP